MSSPSTYGVDSLKIGDCEYLLAVGGGWAIHLVPEAADAEDRRPAVPAEDLDPRTQGSTRTRRATTSPPSPPCAGGR
jgi:hypothetical protein